MDLLTFSSVFSYVYESKELSRYFRVITKFDECGIQTRNVIIALAKHHFHFAQVNSDEISQCAPFLRILLRFLRFPFVRPRSTRVRITVGGLLRSTTPRNEEAASKRLENNRLPHGRKRLWREEFDEGGAGRIERDITTATLS